MLCSLYFNHIGAEGASALAAVLKETRISKLRCAATHPMVFAFVSAPLLALTILAPPLTHSLGGNGIGDEGASALAAVLKETQITKLKCAATPSVCLSASAC